ncbi:Ras-GEF domain-containing protein [Entamoeba marina]
MNPPVLKSKRKAAASTKIMFDGENFNIASPFLRAVSSSPQINKGTDVQSEYPLNRARRSSVYKRQSGISLTSIDNSNIDTEVEIPSFLMNIVTAIQQINSQLNDEEFEKTKGVPRDLGEFQRINNISNEELVSSFFVVLQQYNVSLLVDVGECGRIQRPFGHSDIVSARVTVWKLNEQKRAILKSCVNIYRWLIDESGMIGSTLFKILIHSSFVNIQDMITIALFMECLKTHENEIFECEGHDPFFASDKIQCVIAGTQETLFNILFDPYFINEDYLWQYTNIIPYFMTQHQFLTQLLTSLNHFIKFCNSPGASMDEISVKKKRLERIVLMWIENVGQFIAETEPEVISLLLESDFLKSQQLDNHFILSLKEMTHSLILSNKNTQVHLHKKDAFKMENLFVETKIKEVDELASFKSKIFADQLVLFDHQQFAKLKGYDAYVDSGKDSLQQYVNCNRCIETWALLTGEKVVKNGTSY